MAHDPIIKGRVQQIWHRNRGCSAQEIHEKCQADPIIGSDWPSPETIGIWIKKEFKPNYRPLGSEEDDVVDPWSEQPEGPFDHERFQTLIVLAHVAGQVMDRYAIKGFEGLTKRQANWACKLQSFFNLSNPLEALVLLLFTFQFSQNERFDLEMGKTEPIDRLNPLSQALMAWVWWDPSTETNHVDRFYPWEYGEGRTSRMVAIASGLLPEPIDVTSPGDIPPFPPITQ